MNICGYLCRVSVISVRRQRKSEIFRQLLVQVPSTKLNLLNTKRRLLYLKISSYRAVNTFHLGYKNQSVYAVSGTSRCFFQINTKHINTVWAERTVVEC